jgi:2-succinyl-5-enolpyruvyl-6-hydroxy-3-cyclohexene-1-carboxylate synthase
MPARADRPAWRDGAATRSSAGARRIDASQSAALAADVRRADRGVIICGPQDDPALPAAAARLASALNWPLLADALSGARCGAHDRSSVVTAYDAFLRDVDLAADLRPDLIIRLGAQPTSKPLVQYIRRHHDARQILTGAESVWTEPIPDGAQIVHADAAAFCESLADAAAGTTRSDDWRERWSRCEQAAHAAIASFFGEQATVSEPAVFVDLAAALPEGATLFAGNSMPVRDLDTFFPQSPRAIRFMANRGVNGIDGVVSSALGAAAVDLGPVVLVIGDLSFYHDMNGLLALKRYRLPVTIVLVNNNGGGIFSFLPQAQYEERFERLFGTPHGLDFRAAAELYGIGYARTESREAFRRAVAESVAAGSSRIIEVRTERGQNVEIHREIWRRVAAAIAERGR